MHCSNSVAWTQYTVYETTAPLSTTTPTAFYKTVSPKQKNCEAYSINQVFEEIVTHDAHNHLLSKVFISHYNMHKTVRIAHVLAQPLQRGLERHLDPMNSDRGHYKEWS